MKAIILAGLMLVASSAFANEVVGGVGRQAGESLR